ncbi:MAG: hypothetical protein FWG88_11050 [Oscillospiraceae bacterium]|nr:hypothetical protein [Oscillospiraceae bacterium]
MNMKKSVKSILQPAMEKAGLILVSSSRNHYAFSDSLDTLRLKNTIHVVVDKDPYPPPLLRVHIGYRTETTQFKSFPIDAFTEYENLRLSYENQEELDEKMRLISEILVLFAIPFAIDMRDNHVYRHKDIKYANSPSPEIQAWEYAHERSLPMTYEPASFHEVEKRIAELRGDSIKEWRQNFDKHIEELLVLSLYYGELYRLNDPHNWKWTSGPYNHYELVNDMESPNPPSTHNPLIRVITYWNNGYFINNTLVPADLRIILNKGYYEVELSESDKAKIANVEQTLEEAYGKYTKERIDYLMANYPIDTPNDLEFFDEVDKRRNGE